MKKPLLIGCLALVACCCCSLFTFGILFGYYEINGNCAYRGPLATATSGACAPADKAEDGKSSSPVSDLPAGWERFSESAYGFTFAYPSEYTTRDTEGRLYVYAPGSDSGFTANINISAPLTNSELTSVKAKSCQQLGEGIQSDLAGIRSEIVSYEELTVGQGHPSCSILLETEINNLNLVQEVYYIISADGGAGYVATITVSRGDQQTLAGLQSVVSSFDFRD